MKNSILIALLIGVISACGSHGEGNDAQTRVVGNADSFEITEPKPVDETALREEVESLGADYQKLSFLKEILTEDQRVRQEEIEANQTYGYNSVEHKKSQQNIIDLDASNLKRIDIFTEVYGEPQVNSVGRLQSEATWLVVHHSPGIDVHEKYFPILYFAWKNDLISGTNFTLYLNRWYERVSGERHMMEGSYTEEEEVKVLMGLLNL